MYLLQGLVVLTLFLSVALPSIAAEKYSCWASKFNGQSESAGRTVQIFLSVYRIQEADFPPAPSFGTYRIWEGTRILAEGPFLPNYENRNMVIPIGVPSPGWHSLRSEYFDTSGRYSRCDTDNFVFFIGSGNPPSSFLEAPGGEVFFDEPHSLHIAAAAELTGTYQNSRLQTVNPVTKEILFSEAKDYLVANTVPRLSSPQSQTTVLPIQLELWNRSNNSLAFRDPVIHRITFIHRTRLRVFTVVNKTEFGDSDSFELQANFTSGKFTSARLFGRLEWFDGALKIGEQIFDGKTFDWEPLFLRRQFESPGMHSYRVEYTAAPVSAANPFPVPSGISTPLVVNIAAPTQLTLGGDGLTAADANSIIRLRAQLSSRAGPVPLGQIEFALNGAVVGSVPVVNGAASLELRNLPSGNYRAEARFSSTGGYLSSRSEISFNIAAGITIRHAASGSSSLAPGALASLYGTSISSQTIVNQAATPPSNLGGVSLQLRDSSGRIASAGLLYVSATQINFLVPDNLSAGAATLTINLAGRPPIQTSVDLRASAPGLFTMNGIRLAAGVMVIRNTEGETSQQDLFDCSSGLCRERTIRLPGNLEAAVLVLYGTGFKNIGNLAAAQVNTSPASILYAGPQGQFPGLDQLNILWLPQWRGRFNLILSAGSSSSNTVELSIE